MTSFSQITPADFGLSRDASPVRVIRPRTGRKTMPGWFPTKKGTLPSLRAESNLEMDGFAHFEVNPRCVLMAAQPHRLTFPEPLPEGGTRIATYVPDLAIRMDDGTVAVVDFKVARYARLPRWAAREAVLRRCYADHGATFRTVTDEAIGVEPRATNVRVMLARRPWQGDREAAAAVDAAIAALGLPTTIAAIRGAAGLREAQPDADRAFSAVVDLAIRGVVALDLGRPFGDATVVSAPAGRARG